MKRTWSGSRHSGLGVDEHVWHHVSELPIADGGRGPKQLTGIVDLTPDADGRMYRFRLPSQFLPDDLLKRGEQ